ncbi:MAG: rhomboid family intramembrane serine protease [Phototrophicaceae bacterium]
MSVPENLVRDIPKQQQVKLRIPTTSPISTLVLLIFGGILSAYSVLNPYSTVVLDALGMHPIRVLVDQRLNLIFTSLFVTEGGAEARLVWGSATLLMLYTHYIVGMEMERLWGTQRYLLVYMMGGIGGVMMGLLFYSVSAPARQSTPFAGMAVAVMATLGAGLVYLIKHRKLLAKPAEVRRNFLLGVAGANLILGAFSPHTDIFALLGGMMCGLLLGWIISPYHTLRNHPDEPGVLLAEDVNPLHRHYLPLLAYTIGLVALYILTRWIMGVAL